MNGDVEGYYGGYYGGIAPVEVGNLDDVKEERQVIPATRNVKLLIRKAEGRSNKDDTWRSIHLELQVVDGIDADGKYKNKMVFTNVCYYADPNVYTKEWFTKRQHLVQLKYLKRAIGFETNVVDGHLIDELMFKEVLADIIVKKNRFFVDDGKGGKEEVEQLDNEARNFKSLSIEQQI